MSATLEYHRDCTDEIPSLLSGGADSSIGIWDLESEWERDNISYKPLSFANKYDCQVPAYSS